MAGRAGPAMPLGTSTDVIAGQPGAQALRMLFNDLVGDVRLQAANAGLCAIDVMAVDGEIDHRDVFFSDHQKQENRKICACVSRARGTITVDTLHRLIRSLSTSRAGRANKRPSDIAVTSSDLSTTTSTC